MNEINWKVRLKNPMFWVTAIPSLIALAYTFLGIFGITPGISQDNITNVFATIVALFVNLGVIADPTTKGLADSERALTYDKPN